jgi:AraC-like DNA-binding protein
MDLLWISNGDGWLCGPETTSWTFALPPGTAACGVRFRSGFGGAFAGISASRIVNQRISVANLKISPSKLAFIRERMNSEPFDTGDRLTDVEEFVRQVVSEQIWIDAVEQDRQFATSVLLRLTQAPRLKQNDLAIELGMSVRQLHRVSLRCFGYGTATLARLLRFQRFLALVQVAQSNAADPTPLVVFAIEAGYSDHAHLARDCRSITSQTPSEFLSEYFPTFPDMSDPYKTDESFAVSMAV